MPREPSGRLVGFAVMKSMNVSNTFQKRVYFGVIKLLCKEDLQANIEVLDITTEET